MDRWIGQMYYQLCHKTQQNKTKLYGPLTRYVKLRIAHAPGMPGIFPRLRLQRKPLVSDPGVHARAVMHAEIANPRWQGKRCRHSRRICNPQY